MIRSINGKTPQVHPSAFVSETAYIVGEVTVGENSSIWPGAVIRGDFGSISIGSNTAIEDNCVVHSWDCIIGDNVIVGHNAVIHCKSIGDGCMVGINAVLLQGAEIGEKCFIAAGSLITPDTKIPPRSLVMGSPAKIKQELNDEKLAAMMMGKEAYVQLARQYKQQGL